VTRVHLNIGLLAVVAALVTWLAFAPSKDGTVAQPLFPLRPEQASSIALLHPNKPAIRLQKQGTEWHLIAPVKAETDPFEVNGILLLLGQQTTGEVEGNNFAEWGLKPPQYEIQINGKSLKVGGSEPLKNDRYVQRFDGKVYLTDDLVSAALDADYSDLLSKKILPARLQASDIRQIKLPKLTVSGDGKNWRAEGIGTATPVLLNSFIQHWLRATAMYNQGEEAAAPSTGEAIDITLASGEVLHFVLAATEPQLILARQGVRYVLSKEDEAGLFTLNPQTPAVPATLPVP
jgi:hypothetical protein